MDAAPRVLLVSPPGLMPYQPGLAVVTLRAILECEGIPAGELHAGTLLPVNSLSRELLTRAIPLFFGPLLFPHIRFDDQIDRVLETCRADSNLGGLLYPDAEATFGRLDIDEQALRRDVIRGFALAQACLDRCVEAAGRRDYDVVCFSVTFESQLVAALALATRLRALRPSVRLAFGGPACSGVQAQGVVASFDVVDAACYTEGEAVIGPLVRALREGAHLDGVPGIAFREADGSIAATPPPPLLRDLDALPIPSFHTFLEQFERSGWRSLYSPALLFETSRGCFHGARRPCTFCGLNADGIAFRRKSPERALREIRLLYEEYPQADRLQATDNVLCPGHLREVIPRLRALARDPARPLQLFYEVRPDLRRADVAALAAAGVTAVQPGVESFGDRVLQLMRKGATAAGNVELIKWCVEEGVEPVYNLLLAIPGERARDYEEMLALLPYLEHLPAPTGITPMLLERHSQYHREPAAHGITAVRPGAQYRALYPGVAVELERLAYVFDFDHAMHGDELLTSARRAVARQAVRWRESWRQRPASFDDRGDRLMVTDARASEPARFVVSGSAVALFRALDRARADAALAGVLPDVHEELRTAALRTWEHRRWLARIGAKSLVVLPKAVSARPPGASAPR